MARQDAAPLVQGLGVSHFGHRPERRSAWSAIDADIFLAAASAPQAPQR